MIKRYSQFINEKIETIDICDIIPIEEIEDQFLRLKEVYNLSIRFEIASTSNFYSDRFNDTPDVEHYVNLKKYVYTTCRVTIRGAKYNYDPEIDTELEQIKYRIENMFDVKVRLENSDPKYSNERYIYFQIISNEQWKKLYVK